MSLFEAFFRRARVSPPEEVNPVAATVQHSKDRTRGRLAEGMVEPLAQQMHADDSFEPWSSLSEVDRELWRHLARLELMSNPTRPIFHRHYHP